MQPASSPPPAAHYYSFNRYEDIHIYRDRLQRGGASVAESGRSTIGPSALRTLSKPTFPEADFLSSQQKAASRKHFKLDVLEPQAPRVYESMSKCSNDADSINSFKSDGSNKNFVKSAVTISKKTTPNHYVDMAKTLSIPKQTTAVPCSSKEMLLTLEKDVSKVYNIPSVRPLQDNSNRIQSTSGKRSDKMVRRHTTEYRGPQLVLPPMKNDSSDSAERSPVATHTSHPYPYLVLTEQRLTKKKTSITSSTSEDNSDAVTAAIKLRMQGKEWRENKVPKRIESLTVDRKFTKKHQAKSAKMKRQGSFNIDPAGEFHMSLDVSHGKDMSCSVRSCNPAKSPLMDARKNPLQISAEDMVQIANCGARNKNGSLCHFISTNADNYLSISQALLNQSSGSEAKLAENDTLPRKYHTMEKKKKSTHSLAFESSDETLCQPEKYPNIKDRREEKMLAKYRDEVKNNTSERRHKGHSRQRSHDLEKTVKVAKYRQDSTPGRKLVHTKSEGQRGRILAGYFLLEDENGHTLPVHLGSGKNDPLKKEDRREGSKYNSPSTEMLDKKHMEAHKEACKCVMLSNHSLAKAECSYRDKSDFSSDTDPMFRRLGNSSREELTTTSGGDVEESFDF